MPPSSPGQSPPAGENTSSSSPDGDVDILKSGLAAVILTFNEADHVVECIDSLRWADQIVVFDSYSDDATVDLARQAGAMIGQARFQNYASQRNAALDYLAGQEFGGWVLFVDADERGTVQLGAEIRQVIAAHPEAGWFVPRHNYIFGKLTTGAGWYPDYQLRLLKHGKARYERPVHEVAVVDGAIGYLKNPSFTTTTTRRNSSTPSNANIPTTTPASLRRKGCDLRHIRLSARP